MTNPRSTAPTDARGRPGRRRVVLEADLEGPGGGVHDGFQVAALLGREDLGRLVLGDVARHLVAGPLHEVRGAAGWPLELRPVDHQAGNVVFLVEVLERVVGREEGLLAEQLAEQVLGFFFIG